MEEKLFLARTSWTNPAILWTLVWLDSAYSQALSVEEPYYCSSDSTFAPQQMAKNAIRKTSLAPRLVCPYQLYASRVLLRGHAVAQRMPYTTCISGELERSGP